ncbi:MAG TPA: putative glycoside hydrolase [Candidatus Paceibacterota bacterium]
MKRKEIIRAILWGVSTVFILSVLTFITESFPLKHQVQKYDSLYEMAAVVTVPQPFIVTHINTPEEVKALYMTSWVAGNVKLRNDLIDLIDTTELNALVIDVKDYTGKISFSVSNTPALNSFGSAENRIPEIERFIGMLHDKGIYVIGRISVFQDSYLVKTHPEYAVKTKSGAVWKDRKGVSWLDAGAKPVWDYIIKIADKAYDVGFDEINFDYIRFPSDGNMNDIYYPYSNGKNKSRVLKDFFAYIDKYFHEKNIPISADLFGMTTSNTDDLGIGQILEDALLHFDFVAPMVYPSHYPTNFNGWKNPEEKPYDVVHYAMKRAVARAEIASTTKNKLRPWLQDFSINGTHYTKDMVRAQIQATYDTGLNSWMMWNASNKYTGSAYTKD